MLNFIITIVAVYAAFRGASYVNRQFVPGLIAALPKTTLANSLKSIHLTALLKSFVWVSMFFIASLVCDHAAPLAVWLLAWAALFGMVHIKADVLD